METGMIRRPINTVTIGYQLAPRINAAGRMDDARLALDVLIAETMEVALPLAEHIERHNLARREATERAVAEAEERLAAEGEVGAAIVLADERWALGLVGLVAGRLAGAHHTPAFILNRSDDECRGSARSVEGFNVVEALDSAAQHLQRYGGHVAAAGFSCTAGDYEALAAQLKAFAASQRPEGGWELGMAIDARLDLKVVTLDAVRGLSALEPFGEGNPPPLVCCEDVEVKAAAAFGGDRTHLKLWLGSGERVVEAIAWGRAELLPYFRIGGRVDVLCSLSINSWDSEPAVRLELRDVRRAERPAVALAT
jgi:single-stranded-DNA-specific exonuclease